MQISSVTGLSLSRLQAPVSLERRTGAAEAITAAQETARTASPSRTTDRPGITLPSLPQSAAPSGNPDTLIVSPTFNPARLESARNGFRQSVRNQLNELSDRVSRLLDAGDFTTRRSRVSRPEVLSVTPGNNTPLDRFNFSSTRLSQGQVLASDPFTSGSALGLNGRFLINGVAVDVESTDGLSDIRDKINQGEDRNGNGILDGPEDLNANEQIDIIEVEGSEQGPSRFIVEDINGNGVLDPGEDSNNNDRLDGGTEENRVVAGITDDRLILASETGGASAIALSDPDDVLLTLGFFELNAKGRPIQKEAQFDFDRQTPTNLNTSPQTAQIEIDGERLESNTNEFTNAIEDAVVELRQKTDNDTEVRIEFDTDEAVQEVESLVEDFNDVVGGLNRIQKGDPPTIDDPEAATLQSKLTQTETPGNTAPDPAPVNDALPPFDRLTPPVTGQPLKEGGTRNFNEFFTSDAAQSIEDGLRTEPSLNTSVVSDQFQKIGIGVQPNDTLELDKPALEQAFENDFEKVRELFFEDDTGLLTQLQSRLDTLLDNQFGPLTLSEDSLTPSTSSSTNNQFRAAVESLISNEPERTLLAIV